MSAPITVSVDLSAVHAKLERIMTELENLQAAVASEDQAITDLAAEQATFLADVAARIAALEAAAGVDPAVLAPITADITARVADLQALTAAEVAADPAPAAAAPAEPVV